MKITHFGGSQAVRSHFFTIFLIREDETGDPVSKVTTEEKTFPRSIIPNREVVTNFLLENFGCGVVRDGKDFVTIISTKRADRTTRVTNTTTIPNSIFIGHAVLSDFRVGKTYF